MSVERGRYDQPVPTGWRMLAMQFAAPGDPVESGPSFRVRHGDWPTPAGHHRKGNWSGVCESVVNHHPILGDTGLVGDKNELPCGTLRAPGTSWARRTLGTGRARLGIGKRHGRVATRVSYDRGVGRAGAKRARATTPTAARATAPSTRIRTASTAPERAPSSTTAAAIARIDGASAVPTYTAGSGLTDATASAHLAWSGAAPSLVADPGTRSP
jgi:hypothetical protein